uniref:Uncharacterized protein MANES_01G110400 n=1 Tax=Rhizophora mucronata TaxID=61149 RepID=A0A2P2MQ88_RHIMU
MVMETLVPFSLKGLQGSWQLLDMGSLPWITQDLVFQKVFMLIFPVLTNWLMMLSSISPESKRTQSFLLFLASCLDSQWVEKVHLKQPNAWNGAVLVAPMCKIADDIVPPWAVKQFLIGMANILPKQKLVPLKDLAEAAYRDLKKRELAAYNVIAYKDKPRLRTALELLKVAQEIESQLKEILNISLPLCYVI